MPRNRGKNTTLLASMGIDGMGCCLAVEGSTTAGVFEAYVERVLAPSLLSGQVVVMDNLAAHKGQRIKELIEERGCELMYLSPYSPDLNPIEEAFSKVKRLLRETEARTRKGLIEAMGAAISAVTAQDAHGFFEHCGYRIVVRSYARISSISSASSSFSMARKCSSGLLVFWNRDGAVLPPAKAPKCRRLVRTRPLIIHSSVSRTISISGSVSSSNVETFLSSG